MLIRSPALLLEFEAEVAVGDEAAAAAVAAEEEPLLKSTVRTPSRDMIAFMFSGCTQAGSV